MLHHCQISPTQRIISVAMLAACFFASNATATAPFQRVFIDKYIKDHPDKDYAKFMKRKVRCLICHQGKGGHHENTYGKPMAELLDAKADKKNTEKILAAIDEVNQLPLDPEDPTGETFGDRITAGKIPAADDLESLKTSPESEAISLFDGESLEGWIGATKSYEVRDGVIACIKGTGGNLFTENEYSDFEFSFEFRLTPGANNGLGIRSPLEGDPAYVAIELQILDNDADKYKNLQQYQYHGSAYGVAAAKRGALNPTGEWNHQTVRCEGRQITVTLNDEVILDINLDKAAPDGKTIDGREHPGLSRESGHIGFLGHGDMVEFRAIEIVDLAQAAEYDDENEKEDE